MVYDQDSVVTETNIQTTHSYTFTKTPTMNKKHHSLALLFLLFMQASCGIHGAIKGTKHPHVGGSNEFESVSDQAWTAYRNLIATKENQPCMVDFLSQDMRVEKVGDHLLYRIYCKGKAFVKSLLFFLEHNNILNIYFDKFLQFECNDDCLALPVNIKKTIKELTVDIPYFWHYKYISKNKSIEYLLNRVRNSMGFKDIDFEKLTHFDYILEYLYSAISRKFVKYRSIDARFYELYYAQTYGLNIYEYFSSYLEELTIDELTRASCMLHKIRLGDLSIEYQKKIIQGAKKSEIHSFVVKRLFDCSIVEYNLPAIEYLLKETGLHYLIKSKVIQSNLKGYKRSENAKYTLSDDTFKGIRSKIYGEPFSNYKPRHIYQCKSEYRNSIQKTIQEAIASGNESLLSDIDIKYLNPDQRLSLFLCLEWPYNKVEGDLLLEIIDWEYIFFQPARFHSTAKKYSTPSQRYGLFQRLLKERSFKELCNFWNAEDVFNYLLNTRIVPYCLLNHMITYDKTHIFSSTFRPVHLLEAIITSSIAENKLSRRHADFVRCIIHTYGIRSIISEKFKAFYVLNTVFKNGTKDDQIFYKKAVNKILKYITPRYCQIYRPNPPDVIIDLISRYIDN